MRVEVFNGDADGLCALRQWRQHYGAADLCISGVKRDIALLQQTPATATEVTVFDLSLAVNAAAAERLLSAGCRLRYIDHHAHGALPTQSNFTAHIDTDPTICTALIVDRLLGGEARDWAVAGAYGDNMLQSAQQVGAAIDTTTHATLQRLGTLLNYNGYGLRVEDLHIHPVALAAELDRFASAVDCAERSTLVAQIAAGYRDDHALLGSQQPYHQHHKAAFYLLPNASWARRISGTLANHLAQAQPDQAHAVAVETPTNQFVISIRAPINRPLGAGTLAQQYPDGGGRAAAAGVNSLPAARLDHFIRDFSAHFN